MRRVTYAVGLTRKIVCSVIAILMEVFERVLSEDSYERK